MRARVTSKRNKVSPRKYRKLSVFGRRVAISPATDHPTRSPVVWKTENVLLPLPRRSSAIESRDRLAVQSPRAFQTPGRFVRYCPGGFVNAGQKITRRFQRYRRTSRSFSVDTQNVFSSGNFSPTEFITETIVRGRFECD